jgi:short subunit dehydrogenase-like uncharacterized protein
MPDILLFGATGFTGRLTAKALARRGADFAIAGRSRTKLEALSESIGSPTVHIAHVGDTASLGRALRGSRVLVTCVGPFVELGMTAASAALESGVHYIDSTGEVNFVDTLLKRFDADARSAGIAMAPALGFDEVPADVGVALACVNMVRPSVKVTFATPTTASQGTLRSSLGILTTNGWRVARGRITTLQTADGVRWAPMPPPLGVRRSISAPMAIGRLAPLHVDLESLDCFVTTGTASGFALKYLLPALKTAIAIPTLRRVLWKATERFSEGPSGASRRAKWTVLIEARSGSRFKNVVVTGRDVYGLSAELLAAGAMVMSDEKYSSRGVLAPVDAIGLETLHKELVDFGVTIESFEPL